MADPIPRRADATKATLSADVFDDPNWIVERKLDGFRCLAFRDGGPVELESRNRLSLNQRYPEVAAALEDAPSKRFVVDGEVVGLSGGRSSFEALQRRAHEGERLLREACRKGWEGLIAKRADSPYAGKRTRDWLKWKCSAEQELVIGGYTAPRGSREDFGALLVGHYDGGVLRYAGKVGTGFDARELRTLGARMAKLAQPDSPFGAGDPPRRDTTWVKPQLVAQIAFTEWTRDGRLRHPRYLGLRDDKPAREVVRERPS